MNTTKMLIKQNIFFSLPVLLSMLSTSISGFLIMLLVAKLGSLALAASALIYVIYSLLFTLAFSFLVPIAIFIGQAYGSQQLQNIGAIFLKGAIISAILAMVIILLIPFIPSVLSYFGQPKSVSLLVASYFRPFVYVVPAFLFILLSSQFLMAINKPLLVMLFSIFSLPINLFLSYSWMFGKFSFPNVGIVGSCYASIVSSYLTLFVMIFYFFSAKSLRKFKLMSYQKTYVSFSLLLKTGAPIALQRLAEIAALALITLLMAKIPNPVAALDAQQVVLQCSMIALMIPFSLAQSAGILVSQAYGQNNLMLAKQHVSISIFIGIGLMSLVGLAYIVFAQNILRFYIDSTNIVALHYGFQLLYAYAAVQIIDAARNILTGALRGFADTFYPMLIGIFSTLIMGVFLSYLFAFKISPGSILGLPLGFSLGLSLGIGLLYWRFKFKTYKQSSKTQSELNHGY